MAAVRHVAFLNIAILNALRHKECQCASPCEISWKSVKRLRRYCDFNVLKMAAAAILDFQKFKFLPAYTLERPNLRKLAKFHKDRPIRCWDLANFRFFKITAVRHVAFLNIAILNALRHKECQCSSPCEISWKSVKRLRRYYDFKVSKIAEAAILDFHKFKLLGAGMFESPHLRHSAKFHQDRSILCWDMAIFLFFKMAAVRRVDCWNCDFKCSAAQGVPMRATVWNFVKIGQTVAEVLRF